MKFWRTALVATLALTVMLSVTGGTIAWFTDTVTTKTNTIQAGNLDIELYYKTDWAGDWAPVTEDTKVFDDAALYEPGYTKVVYLKTANEGSLALKYRLNLKINEEILGKTKDGEFIKLSDYLTVGCLTLPGFNEDMSAEDMMDTTVKYTFGGNDREKFMDLATGRMQNFSQFGGHALGAIVEKDVPLFAGEDCVTMLVVAMPTTVGNEANHDGVNVPSIKLGIEVEATQAVKEPDSFGNDYDKDALYPSQVTTAAELKSALEAGKKNISLANNTMDMDGETIALPDGVTIADGTVANATLTVADGQTANFDNVTFNNTTSVQAQSDGNLNFQDCKFDVTPDKLVGNSRGAAIIGSNQNNTIDLILEGCTFNYTASSADTYNAAVFMWSSVKNVIVRNCTFNGYGFVAVKLMNVAEGANILFEGNTFNMCDDSAANYHGNNAVQIMPQHDRTMTVTFKDNTFTGDYETSDDGKSIVATIEVMDGGELTKTTLKLEGNKFGADENAAAVTADNFATQFAAN